MLLGAKLLGYDLKCLSVREQQAIAVIEDKALEEKQPIVLKFTNLRADELLLDNGAPFFNTDFKDCIGSFRYKGQIDFHRGEIVNE